MPRTELTGSQIKDQSVSLTADVTGTLPVANGGTGSTTFALNNALLGNGTGALQAVAPGAAGNVLTSDGSTWVSQSGTVTLNGTQTLTNKVLTAPRIGQINDPSSGTVSVALLGLTNAINYPVLAGTPTGVAPELAVAGTDTNISLNLASKGSGTVNVNGIPVVTTTGTQTLTNKTIESPTVTWPTVTGAILSTRSTATGLSTFSIGPSTIGNVHVQNGQGTSATDQNQAAITFSGGDPNSVQAGIYVLNNNTDGTRMGFATTNNYGTGPQLFLTASNTGVVNFPRALPQHNGVNLVDLSSTQTLTNKVLTSPIINGPTGSDSLVIQNNGNTTFTFNQYGEFVSLAGYGIFYDGNVSTTAFSATGALFLTSGKGGTTSQDITLKPSGTGKISLASASVEANGVPVVTTTGTQTLTNKTFTNPNVNGNLWLTGNATLLYPGVYLGPDANAGLNYAHEGGYHSAISTDKSLVLTNLVGDIVITNRTASKSIIFGTGGTSDVERMRITSAGNVGIGTTSPAVKLDVFDGAAWFRRTANGLQTNLQLGRMDDGTTIPLYLVQTDDTNGDILRFHSQRWGAQFQFSRNGPSGDRQIAEIQGSDGVGGTVSVFDASNTTTAQIRGAGDTYFNGGNVGIGTTSPAAKLDVAGAVRIADSTEPATPTGGGVLYVESGALKYKGSSGTVTTLGAA